MDRNRFAVVALLSGSVVGLEVVWTRILSAEFFYTFAFLVLSLAILGLGLGALAVRLFPLLRREGAVEPLLVLASLTGAGAPAAVLKLGLDFSALLKNPWMGGRLALALLILGLPFFFFGSALAGIFRRHGSEMPRLYFWDLAGAATGALLAVPAMNMAGVPAASALACIPAAIASVLAAGRIRIVHIAAWGLLTALGVFSPALLDVPRKEVGPVILRHWDAMGLLKVHELGPEARNIQIDNAANSPVMNFGGDLQGEQAKALSQEFLFAFAPLFQGRGYTLCAIGAGGGSEVLQGLLEGAVEIHAVEVNGAINRMMADGFLADYSGRIYKDPRVKVVTEDARTYLRRNPGRFNLLASSSSNSFAALASGAFALSENYLFTTEAFRDYLRALKPGGYLVMEHQFYVPRAVPEVLDALRAEGVAKPEAHLAVFDLPGIRRKVLLLGRDPLPDSAVDSVLGPLTPDREKMVKLLYAPGRALEENPVGRMVREGWQKVQPAALTNLRPCTDDRPFAAQMGRWKNLTAKRPDKLPPYEFFGFPLAVLLLLTILAVAGAVALPLMALPAFLRGPKLGAVPWLYFFAIGVAFMAVEAVLVQQYTLLVGASAHTVAVILLALLLASGLGSRASSQVSSWVPFVGILAWLALDIAFFPAAVSLLGALPFGLRLLAAGILVAPLGFFMGMPFPKAAVRVGETVDWGFAVTGVASVLGSAGALLLAIGYGFRAALAAAAGFYLLAFLLLAARRAWPSLDAV
jgi:hypothetical protein